MKADSQEKMILKHLQEKGSITSLKAIAEYGCTRLASRIFTLRKAGYVIETTTESAKNRFGRVVNFAKYTLVAEPSKDGEETTEE